MNKKLILVALSVTGAAVAQAQLFQADSATAGSTFNSLYTINNTINGTGLPANFGLSDAHAAYSNASGGNHWTTLSGAIGNGTAWAKFFFDSEVTIGTFHMWNHQSNGGLASNPNYDVTSFDLVLKDEGGNELFSLLGATALEDITVAQSYAFAPVSGVREVEFTILSNANNNQSYTGLAEVAFEAVPEPATMTLLGLGAAALLGRRKRA